MGFSKSGYLKFCASFGVTETPRYSHETWPPRRLGLRSTRSSSGGARHSRTCNLSSSSAFLCPLAGIPPRRFSPQVLNPLRLPSLNLRTTEASGSVPFLPSVATWLSSPGPDPNCSRVTGEPECRVAQATQGRPDRCWDWASQGHASRRSTQAPPTRGPGGSWEPGTWGFLDTFLN